MGCAAKTKKPLRLGIGAQCRLAHRAYSSQLQTPGNIGGEMKLPLIGLPTRREKITPRFFLFDKSSFHGRIDFIVLSRDGRADNRSNIFRLRA